MLLRVCASHRSFDVLRLRVNQRDSVEVDFLKDLLHRRAFRSFKSDVVEHELELILTLEPHSENLGTDIKHTVQERCELLLLGLSLLGLILRHSLDLVENLKILGLNLVTSEHHEGVFEEVSSVGFEKVFAFGEGGDHRVDFAFLEVKD